MAGPGIRYHNIATLLSKDHDVTLAVFNPTYIEGLQGTSYSAYDIHVQRFQEEFSKYDVIVALWLSDEMIQFAKAKGIVLVFDLYAPVPVEDLVQRVFGDRLSSDSDYDYKVMLENYRHFIRNADFSLVSNEQQRDFWLGYAFASGKTYPSAQHSLPIDSQFGICPMGIDLGELKDISKRPDLLTKRVPSLAKNDFIIVWTGGIWDWFDAKTPIKAVHKLVENGNKNIKLVFLGTKHPNDDVPAMAETEKARTLAKELSLLNKNVLFLDGWLPYNERISYLKRADIALYAHKPSIESRFSHRTRVLDHILLGLPTVGTRGDHFSDYIEANHLGICVNPYDVDGMVTAIKQLAIDNKMLRSIRQTIVGGQGVFTWENTLSPLVDYLNGPAKPSAYITREAAESTAVLVKGPSMLRRLVPRPIKQIIKRALY
jgi:glycosyltransferase involved in cell wall biosynthesis